MRSSLLLASLIAVNLILAVWLWVRWPSSLRNSDADQIPLAPDDRMLANPGRGRPGHAHAEEPETVSPFKYLYSKNPATFAANLREIGCPEETVQDILVAELNARFREQEAALRQRPADHVPYGWSAKTSESKLLERRRLAARHAREKAVELWSALGYDFPIAMPPYATTKSEMIFEEEIIATLPEAKRITVRQVHENYWRQVQRLQERTKGFWQTSDLTELEKLKEERRVTISTLVGAR